MHGDGLDGGYLDGGGGGGGHASNGGTKGPLFEMRFGQGRGGTRLCVSVFGRKYECVYLNVCVRGERRERRRSREKGIAIIKHH
jgi:hypothetical protein